MKLDAHHTKYQGISDIYIVTKYYFMTIMTNARLIDVFRLHKICVQQAS